MHAGAGVFLGMRLCIGLQLFPAMKIGTMPVNLCMVVTFAGLRQPGINMQQSCSAVFNLACISCLALARTG